MNIFNIDKFFAGDRLIKKIKRNFSKILHFFNCLKVNFLATTSTYFKFIFDEFGKLIMIGSDQQFVSECRIENTFLLVLKIVISNIQMHKKNEFRNFQHSTCFHSKLKLNCNNFQHVLHDKRHYLLSLTGTVTL